MRGLNSMNSLKFLSYFLIFKDCLNNIDNSYHNSLFSRIWFQNIENFNMYANQEESYNKEWLETIRKPIYDFIKKETIPITWGGG